MRTDFDSQPETARPARKSGRRYGLLGFLLVIVLMVLFAAGYIPRRHRLDTLTAEARESAASRRVVHVVDVRRSPAATETTLPGSIQPLEETAIYARSDGFLKRRIADIGDNVRAGQLLAEIETPELDQQIRQAHAALQQAEAAVLRARAAQSQTEANLKLADANIKRWRPLVAKGVLAQQEGDQKQADFDAQQANLRAAGAAVSASEADVQSSRANIQRLQELKSFARVTAPFAGVITERNVDTGTLVSAGSNSNVRPMYHLAQIGRLRIYLNVPQAYAPAIRVGQRAAVTVQERPGQAFEGNVTRTASSLEEKTRTLLVEVQVANGSRQLLPGMYAQVKLTLGRVSPPLLVPSDTLLVRSDGTYVAAVGAGDTLHLRKLALGRDYGRDVEVTSGLEGNERVVVNPTDDLKEGETVSVAATGRRAE